MGDMADDYEHQQLSESLPYSEWNPRGYKTKKSVNQNESWIDTLLHKFAGCGYPHPYAFYCEWCDHIPEAKATIESKLHEAEVKGRKEVAEYLEGRIKKDEEYRNPTKDQNTYLYGFQSGWNDYHKEVLKVIEELKE